MVLLGVAAIVEIGSFTDDIQGELTSGLLQNFVGFWPLLIVLIVLGGLVVVFTGRRR